MIIEYNKDWFLRSAELEGETEIGVGMFSDQMRYHIKIGDALLSFDCGRPKTFEEMASFLREVVAMIEAPTLTDDEIF